MALLITGATGHLGPHLLAELRHAADFDRIFVLARGARGSAIARVREIEDVALAQLAARGLGDASSKTRVVAIEADPSGCALPDEPLRRIQEDVTVIIHAAADTRFAAPIDLLRRANVDGTRDLCAFAARCPNLRQVLFVSTACTAGRRTGLIPERLHDTHSGPDGFANAYEQTKWEAEGAIAASGLPARIARLSTCAGSHHTGHVHRFGALHHLLHWLSRGLVPMVPASESTPIDVISTDVAAAWLARAAARDPEGLEVCHVALGHASIALGPLLDVVLPLLGSNKGGIQRPLLVDARVFESFNAMVRLSGDALLARVQESAASVLPALLHPKVYDTSAAERCWGGPLPHPDWPLLLERVIAHGRFHRWGFVSAKEACHA